MGKVVIDLEGNSQGFVDSLHTPGAKLHELNTSVKQLKTDSTAAFTGASKDVKQFGTEIQNSTKQTSTLGKEVDKFSGHTQTIRDLRAQMNRYIADAEKAGQGTVEWTENLKKAGETKEKIKELQAVLGGIAVNTATSLTQAFVTVTQTAIQGFEGVLAVESLFGVKNEEVEKQILKLQALGKLSNLIGEFSQLNEKVTQFKIAFSPVTNLYTSANSAIKNFAKGGVSSFGDVSTGIKNFGTNFVTSIKAGVSSGITGFKSFFAVVKANPLGLILTVIAGIIIAMVELKDKVKPIAVAFDFLGEVIDGIKQAVVDLATSFGLLDSEAERAAKETVKNAESTVAAIGKRYDQEIKYAQATGRETTILERKKLADQQAAAIKAIEILKERFEKEGKLSAEDQKRVKELRELQNDLIVESLTFEAQVKTDAAKKDAKDKEEAAKKAKEYAAKREKIEKELQDALKALQDKYRAALLSSLPEEEKLKLQQKFALDEVDLLEKTLIEKGKAENKNFKLTVDQQNQFKLIRSQISLATADALIKIEVDKANKLAAQRKKDSDTELEFFNLQQKIAEEKVKAMQRPNGVSEEDFELLKQKKILEIQKQGIDDQLNLKKDQIEKEAELQVIALNGQLEELKNVNTKEAQAKADQIEKDIDTIKKKAALELEITKATSSANAAEIQKQLDDLQKKLDSKNKFSFAKLLGLTDAEFSKLKEGLSKVLNEVVSSLSQLITVQQQALDQELQQEQQKEQMHQSKIDSLQSQLEKELQLQQKGQANNVDLLRKEINAEKAAKDSALANERRIQKEKAQLQKEQLILDTISQASNLITAATDIFKALSPLGPIGTGIAIADIGLMIGAFIATKVKAFQIANQSPGFQKGGYTGDKGTTEVAGVVHGQEFVNTAEDTGRYFDLFQGIHLKDKKLIHKGVSDLLKGTGVTMPQDLPANIRAGRSEVRSNELKIMAGHNSDAMQEVVSSISSKVDTLIKQGASKSYTDQNGNLVEKIGNITRITEKKK